MVGVDDLLSARLAQGVALGAGVALLSPVVLPVVGSVVRPVAKMAIKLGIVVYETTAGMTTGLYHGTGRLVDEARAEMGRTGAPTQ